MSIHFRKFDFKSELANQRELFIECFPEHSESSMLSNEHYLWKFQSKPGHIPSAEYVAVDEQNDLLGYYAAIPYQYNVNGKTSEAAMVCDVMTGVKARGKGVFTNLGIYSTDEFKQLDFDFTTGYPIRKEVIPGHLKAGWSINHELPLYARFIKFDSFLKNKKIGFLAPIVNFIYSTCTSLFELVFRFRTKAIKIENYSSFQIDEIDGLDEFCEKWGSQLTISLKKSSAFLNWRLGAPEKKYHIIIARKKTSIIGMLVATEIMKEGVPCVAILDLSVLEENYSISNLLTYQIMQIGKSHGAELLLIMIGKKWYIKYRLFAHSFIKTPFKFYLILKKISNRVNGEILNNENNWHLTWIDSDDL
jgi:hypothetical protein